MTYPLELRENTYLSGGYYPVNLFRNVCAPGPNGRTALYLHWHEHFEIIYVVSGTVSFYIDRQRYDASAGELLFVPSGGLHVGYCTTEERVEYWALVFNRSLLDGPYGDAIHDRYLAPFLDGKLRFPVKPDRSERLEPVRELLRSIKDEFEQKPLAYELAVKAKVYLLFTLLARDCFPERENDLAVPADKRMERFKTLLLHIQKHLDRKLTLAEAARMMNLTPYHFCSVFKAATGRTFVDYVNRLRMDEAEKLLLGGATVTEAAGRVGCGSLNYFTKLYKQIKGTTPSATKRRGIRH